MAKTNNFGRHQWLFDFGIFVREILVSMEATSRHYDCTVINS